MLCCCAVVLLCCCVVVFCLLCALSISFRSHPVPCPSLSLCDSDSLTLQIRCYRFICEGEGEEVEQELAQVFDRLASSMRGIADPLVAIHARAYLARVVSFLLVVPASYQDNTK